MKEKQVERPNAKTSTKSWHYKLMKFVMGEQAPTPQTMHNLCPYYWLVIYSMFVCIPVAVIKAIVFVIKFVVKQLDKFVDWTLIEPSSLSWYFTLSAQSN